MKIPIAPAKLMWAYAYQIVPPQPLDRLETIKALLQHEHEIAKGGARTWEGRFVHEESVTHILVVSDSPEQDGEANHRLEAALKGMHAGFVRTAPLEVTDPPPALPRRGGKLPLA